ncbi:hypothetical protein M0804_015370, partial [Polistes exclamans]
PEKELAELCFCYFQKNVLAGYKTIVPNAKDAEDAEVAKNVDDPKIKLTNSQLQNIFDTINNVDSENEEAESSKDETPSKAMQMLNFKDVEKLLQTFSGDGTLSVKCWMREFEEMAELKKALFNEFEEAINAYKIHELLRKRTKEPGESYQEYIYTMYEIAAQAGLDKASIIQYIKSCRRNRERRRCTISGKRRNDHADHLRGPVVDAATIVERRIIGGRNVISATNLATSQELPEERQAAEYGEGSVQCNSRDG